jgi:ABC-type oligopeptide transport system ATPase subunit
MTSPLIEISGLTKSFPQGRSLLAALTWREAPVLRALNGIDLAVRRGETTAIVGESGCGK